MSLACCLVIGLKGKRLGMSTPIVKVFTLSADCLLSGVFLGVLASGVAWGPGTPASASIKGVSLLGLAISGLLVGGGARLAGGCTSGHGVSGVALLSPSSIIAVMLFMIGGFISANLPDLAGRFPLTSIYSAAGDRGAIGLAVASGLAALISIRKGSFDFSGLVIGGAAGFIFGKGLEASGMSKPENVMNFLKISPQWTPALLVLMGTAVCLNFLAFGAILKAKKPLLGQKFDLPPSKLSLKPIVGGLIFGIGWGIAGVCPGPFIANIAKVSPEFTLAFGVPLVISMALVDKLF